MTVTNIPATGSSQTCDSCGNSRAWGAYDTVSKNVVCTVCLNPTNHPHQPKADRGRFSPPSDSLNGHHGQLERRAAQAVIDAV